jgi:hypothetical protein
VATPVYESIVVELAETTSPPTEPPSRLFE